MESKSVWVCWYKESLVVRERCMFFVNGKCLSQSANSVTEDKPCDAVEYAPVKRGKWEKQIGPYHKCSVCGSSIDSNEVYIAPYCFGCGAKMMEEKG